MIISDRIRPDIRSHIRFIPASRSTHCSTTPNPTLEWRSRQRRFYQIRSGDILCIVFIVLKNESFLVINKPFRIRMLWSDPVFRKHLCIKVIQKKVLTTKTVSLCAPNILITIAPVFVLPDPNFLMRFFFTYPYCGHFFLPFTLL